ncbi:ABC transporter ATP-binding protein [Rhizobium sp. NZLR1]|uniref:ABC transporter ATP-binding protein n=1 Tax=Rhizobium sp. NZLR1 TaxID=2731096 RepID=UPI001A97DB70|nr:ABC transporter ATP-binding protein [Rhizobium sp. NZLR1]MBX5204070.1 ABC transporter ATP-binding protein [Rhizobium sp. NZLR1]QSZ25133.1 ABC transporter ATP-binding protein [Rhizobium sp. NZLR1]
MEFLPRDRVLEVSALSVFYRGRETVRAVDDISFTIDRGEAFGLLGESGSGKSSVALSVLQYLPKTASLEAKKMFLEGRDLRDLSAAQLREVRRKKLSAVYQHPGSALNPSMTIARQVTEQLRGTSVSDAQRKATDILDRVRVRRVDRVLSSYPHELSGGMQQRVVLAMALLANPALIVLDEPTTALDANVKAEIVSLLNELRRDQRTSFLIISHDVDLIAATCERVAVMNSGSIVETGSISSVLHHPSHGYTRDLILSSPRDGFTKRDGLLGVSTVQPFDSRRQHRAAEDQRDDGLNVALRCADISHSFGKHRVLSGINLDIAAGETFGLIGESGSGKSTLARIIAGLQRPDQGAVSIFGAETAKTVERRTKDHRAALQLVFQSPDMTLNPRHRIRRILAGPMKRLTRVSRAEIAEKIGSLISSVRMPSEVVARLPKMLSGGQRQRIAIARAFAAQPKIVILDEPTSALDVSVQATVLNLLNDLQNQNQTAYLLVSHDLKVIRYMADRIGVLFRGRLVEMGTADEIFEGPNHPYTQSLLRPQGLARAVSDDVSSHQDRGCVFAKDCQLVSDQCFAETPQEQKFGSTHSISCWRGARELLPARRSPIGKIPFNI